MLVSSLSSHNILPHITRQTGTSHPTYFQTTLDSVMLSRVMNLCNVINSVCSNVFTVSPSHHGEIIYSVCCFYTSSLFTHLHRFMIQNANYRAIFSHILWIYMTNISVHANTVLLLRIKTRYMTGIFYGGIVIYKKELFQL